jgi:hypothetical protein
MQKSNSTTNPQQKVMNTNDKLGIKREFEILKQADHPFII